MKLEVVAKILEEAWWNFSSLPDERQKSNFNS